MEERNTDMRIKCFKCGNQYTMDMMRMNLDGKNLVCKNCLDRKPVKKEDMKKPEPVKSAQESKKQAVNEGTKEYFCKECKYSFSRSKHLEIDTCPYCGKSDSLMTKGSSARILSDASKMKGDF